MSVDVERLNATLKDRYRIERELGEGGMATVYLADDLRHERRVALKVLKPEVAAVVGAARFLAEIKTTANLQHPHILPLFDSGEADGFLFYVIPLVQGESLRDRLDREHQLPVDDAIRIATNVAEALDYAHRQGVIHRDIKPANILLQDGKPVIGDFGIALAVSAGGGGRLTETGLSLGTPHYMSPEQATGDQNVGPATDIYALGCVLYEMLLGEPPFTGSTSQAVLGKIVTGDAPSASAERRSVPPNVDAGIRKALEKLPADRFATGAELATALAEPGFVHMGDAGVRHSTRAFAHSRAWISASGWVAFLILSVLYVLRAGTDPDVSVRRHQILLPDSAPLALSGPAPLDIWQGSLAVSPDGTQLLYVAPYGRTTRLHLQDMRSGESRPLPGTDGAYSPFFSSDGRSLAFYSGSTLKTLGVEGGQPVPVGVYPETPLGGIWLSNGQILVPDAEGRRPVLVDASGGPGRLVGSVPGGFAAVDALPGERWALGRTVTGQLALLSLDSGELLGITRSGVVPLDSLQPEDILAGWHPRYSPSGHILYVSPSPERGSSGSQLMALPFDADRRRVLGPPQQVQSGLRREVVGYGFAHYAITRAGELIYVAGADAGRGLLAFVGESGAVDTLDFAEDAYSFLKLSPDGTEIMTSIQHPSGHPWEVWILDLERGSRDPLGIEPDQSTLSWGWMPDDSGLLITLSDPVTHEYRDLIVYSRTDGQDQTVGEGTVFWPSVRPQRDVIVGGDARLETMRILSLEDGSEEAVPEGGYHQSFSPDGDWIAFQRARAARVMRFPYTGTSYPVTDGGSDQPFWSADGDFLYYRSGREFWRVSFADSDGRGPPALGQPQLVTQGPFLRPAGSTHALAPDGRILVVLGPPEDSTPRVEVVTGFFDHLDRLAPAVR